jgi:2,4-dienoyl-CoA reductase-like NADH-dependent reductase (Old Yellow Enzyme family)/NADPH-dependent 2,4-dienoyl-CoA reductase/sulfur reductase-like enzyme
MNHRYQKLLTPLVLPNGAVLKNRMIQPKCAPDQIQGPEEWPTEQFIHFHRESARRGNSLVILCDAFRPEVRKMPAWHDFSHSYTFNLDDPGVHNYLCQLADDVHYYGSKVLVNMHPALPMGVSVGGRNAPRVQSAEGFVPSPPGKMATKEQIHEAIETTADRMAEYAFWGYDGAALDAGRDLAAYTDVRTDEYGGCIENRCRFTLELCKRIKEKCGKKFIVHLMLSGECVHGSCGDLPQGYTLEDTITLAKLAQEWGVVDLITIRERSMVDSHPTGYTFQPCEHRCESYVKAMKEAGITLPLAVSGGYQEPDEMEQVLRRGYADLVSIGRGQFTDADYFQKILEERGEDIRPCLRCNRCHGRRRAPWTSVCSVNPEFGVELKTKNMVAPVTRKKKVAIIGGGPAGMQAAITAAQRGHEVTLFEKSDYLGGQLYHADYFSFKWPFKNYRLWLVDQLGKNGVQVKLNTEPTPEELSEAGFDAVIAATGSKAKLPNIQGMHKADGSAALPTCHDVIGHEETLGKRVIMVGCSETGIETACYLAQNGHEVTCLTRQNQLAKDASPLHSITIAWIKYDEEKDEGYMAPYWERFDGIHGITNATTVAVTDTTVTYQDKDGQQHTLEGDSVVVCGGVEPCVETALKYASAAPEFYLIGDAGGCTDIQTGVRSAFAAASQV